LLAFSFPKFGHPACAWMALTPLVIAAVRASRRGSRRAFLLGLVSGAVYFAVTLYWLVETMTTFGKMPVPLALIAAAALVGYLALFPAAFAMILARLHRVLGLRALAFVPAIWVTTELGRQYVWDGFPWALLGYSQVTTLPVAQVASLVGVYGLSALLALTSTAAAYVILDRGRTRWVFAGTAGLIVAASVVWGNARLAASPLLTRGEPVRVAVIQGNVEQEQKWDPAMRDTIADRYIAMTRQALARGATFVIWPESSTPFYFEHDLVRGGEIRRLAVASKATLLIGSDQVEPIRTAAAPSSAAPSSATPSSATPSSATPSSATTDHVKERSYNAAFLVKPDGAVGAVYRKMHLVPFGEYVPLQSLLFFAGPIIGAVADFAPFTAGTEAVLLPVGAHYASTAICYEVIYPNLIRRTVLDGSELLTTITNDAWYGRSSAAYQHWDQSSMRAIEEGRYLARAANTGISGFVDPYGRILDHKGLFETAVLVQDLRFLKDRTVYNRIGDLVAWLSLAVTVMALLVARKS
jgi:apolipoprotein N-acyltransferase